MKEQVKQYIFRVGKTCQHKDVCAEHGGCEAAFILNTLIMATRQSPSNLGSLEQMENLVLCRKKHARMARAAATELIEKYKVSER